MKYLDLAIIHIEDALECLEEGDERELVASFLKEALEFLTKANQDVPLVNKEKP